MWVSERVEVCKDEVDGQLQEEIFVVVISLQKIKKIQVTEKGSTRQCMR